MDSAHFTRCAGGEEILPPMMSPGDTFLLPSIIHEPREAGLLPSPSINSGFLTIQTRCESIMKLWRKDGVSGCWGTVPLRKFSFFMFTAKEFKDTAKTNWTVASGNVITGPDKGVCQARDLIHQTCVSDPTGCCELPTEVNQDFSRCWWHHTETGLIAWPSASTLLFREIRLGLANSSNLGSFRRWKGKTWAGKKGLGRRGSQQGHDGTLGRPFLLDSMIYHRVPVPKVPVLTGKLVSLAQRSVVFPENLRS